MAGGMYSSMNKIRPGAYINFETNVEAKVNIGTRGTATIALPLSWGKESAITEVTGKDLINGDILNKIGLMPTDAEAQPINLALQNCTKLKIFNTNKNGEKAKTTAETGLVATAKYPGAFGNKIAILVKAASGSATFTVETYADGYFVDSQKVTGISDLVDNDFVTFSGTGSLQAMESTLLTGGSNGTGGTGYNYLTDYFKALQVTKWNTMAVLETTAASINQVVDFIKKMREEEGQYVQAVVSTKAITDTSSSPIDYEGIVDVVNGIVLADGTEIAANKFTAWVAGAMAGAEITESITGKIVNDAVSIIDILDTEGIIDALNNGKFVLSLNQNGEVKVEKDINTLHNFTQEKGYIFSKNRVIRELDEIGSEIERIWETTYLGKVSNTEDGRTLFKSSIIDYLTDLQNRGAIQDFDSSTVEVLAGNDIDSVIASIAIKPVDSMEFLYMTVNVDQ